MILTGDLTMEARILKFKLLISAIAFSLGSSASAEPDIHCEDFRSESELLVEVCTCAMIKENDVQRLQCFDHATHRQTLLLIQAKARAERLRRSPGGIEAMQRAIELGPYTESK